MFGVSMLCIFLLLLISVMRQRENWFLIIFYRKEKDKQIFVSFLLESSKGNPKVHPSRNSEFETLDVAQKNWWNFAGEMITKRLTREMFPKRIWSSQQAGKQSYQLAGIITSLCLYNEKWIPYKDISRNGAHSYLMSSGILYTEYSIDICELYANLKEIFNGKRKFRQYFIIQYHQLVFCFLRVTVLWMTWNVLAPSHAFKSPRMIKNNIWEKAIWSGQNMLLPFVKLVK